MNVNTIVFGDMGYPIYILRKKGAMLYYRKKIPFKLVTSLVDKYRSGGMVCNIQYDFPTEIRENDYIGDWWINCNTIYGDSHSIAWLEFEHNAEDRDMYVSINIGTYREACYGSAYLILGHKVDGKPQLYAIRELLCTMLNPCDIVLYGRFPYPRFIIGGYHYCPTQLVSVTGVRIKRVRMWV